MAQIYDRGLVMYLYAAELLRFGARHGLPADEAVDGEHWFLCLSDDPRAALWTPLHPTRGHDRIAIGEAAKTGHPRWTRGVSYFSTGELWSIPHKAIQRAAQVAGDRSSNVQPNRVVATSMPALSRFTPLPDPAPAT